jgi:hypothetical protein
MKHSERFALNEWLCDYPSDKTYEEIIEAMKATPDDWTHEELELWEIVENFPLGQVADLIEGTRAHFESALKDIFKEKAAQ